MLAWLLTGWPRIWNNPPIPPPIEPTQAINKVDNWDFNGNANGWTTVNNGADLQVCDNNSATSGDSAFEVTTTDPTGLFASAPVSTTNSYTDSTTTGNTTYFYAITDLDINSNNSKNELVEQDFTWGVLAINTNKSIYLPNEKAYLQMAVLDDDSHTLCQTALKLEITTPKSETITLSSSKGTIGNSETCGVNNVTDIPDYFAYFQTNQIGLYQLKLINLDNGYQIEDSFEVKDSLPFEVERIAATRTNPFKANYVMNFKIKVNQDYQGQVIETVLSSFEILDHDYSFTNENEKNITWQVDWQTGESYQLSYEYDAPNISPQFYLLGPLKISDFQEARSWQIAINKEETP